MVRSRMTRWMLVVLAAGAPLITTAACDPLGGGFTFYRDDDFGFADHHFGGWYFTDYYYDDYYYADYYYDDYYYADYYYEDIYFYD